MKRKEIVLAWIEKVWNEGQLGELEKYLSPHYVDYSLPAPLPKNIEGTRKWLQATSLSFRHYTIVEDMIAGDNKVFIRISMKLKHIGEWRGYAATEKEIVTTGYRLFEFSGDQIIAQWALIDGQKIEQSIAGTKHGCQV